MKTVSICVLRVLVFCFYRSTLCAHAVGRYPSVSLFMYCVEIAKYIINPFLILVAPHSVLTPSDVIVIQLQGNLSAGGGR